MKRWLLCSFLVALGVGCSNKPPPAPVFVFNRPERIEYICVDSLGDGQHADAARPLVLPLRCCSAPTPLAPTAFFASDAERKRTCGRNTEPALHALVTQSSRGEVAAINLVEREVLDANRRIPGYTFVDVGGLPRAIVAPRELEGRGASARGPAWTYVASVADQTVRAISTCSFLLPDGEACGPHAHAAKVGAPFSAALPAVPADMIYANGALWVSLPDVSAIARIELDTSQGTRWPLPFAGEGGQPNVQLYRIPDRGEIAPEPAVPETQLYELACGLGYRATFDQQLLADSSVALTSGPAQPGRLRFDAETGWLLVADRGQPVIHMFEPSGTEVLDRGALHTGAPVRDFALTGLVPAVTPPLADLARDKRPVSMNAAGTPSTKLPAYGPLTERYVYAIDDRDGTVLAMTFASASGDAPHVIEVQTPFANRRLDRLALTGVATTLEVIDTRALSEPFVCNPADAEGLDEEIDAASRRVIKEEEKGQSAELDEAERVLGALISLRDRALLAGGGSLHGVFLAVADTSGYLTIVDVHDEDLFCRASPSCEARRPTARADDEDVDPPVVSRHGLRRQVSPAVSISLTDDEPFRRLADCPEGYFAAGFGSGVRGSTSEDGGVEESGADVRICATRDPWATFDANFATVYEGAYLRATAPSLRREQGKLVLRGPNGFDFCARGVEPDALDGVDAGYRGDFLVVTGEPSSDIKGCAAPEIGHEVRLRVIEAYDDHLVLDAPRIPAVAENGQRTLVAADLAELLRCYPYGFTFEARLNERHLVEWSGGFLHRIHADDDGRCVADPALDPRLTFRAAAGEPFENPYVAFTLRKLRDQESGDALDTTFTVEGGSLSLRSPLFAGESAEALPVQVSYLDLTGNLYVLDTTSQGLRRFFLSPFAADTTAYR